MEENIEIHINERNQPIGANSVKLSSLVGVLTREMFPINYSDWRKVSGQLKEDLWNIINMSIRHYVYLYRVSTWCCLLMQFLGVIFIYFLGVVIQFNHIYTLDLGSSSCMWWIRFFYGLYGVSQFIPFTLVRTAYTKFLMKEVAYTMDQTSDL